MDPVSITGTAVGLLAAIASLSQQVAGFVAGARDARKDVDGLSREMASLALCLESLKDENFPFPESSRVQLRKILGNCDQAIKEMAKLVKKHSSPSDGRRLEWSLSSRDEAVKLRERIETHKLAIEITLDLANIAMSNAIKEDTDAIKAQLAAIRMQMMQLQAREDED